MADFSRGVIDRDQLDRALLDLEPDRRALVVLHCFFGAPLPEVAGALGIPVGTAKSRLNRALGILRARLAVEELDVVPGDLLPAPEGRSAS